MTITSTAIGFSLLAVGLLFCGIHFFNAFKKISGPRAGARIGIALSVAFVSNAVAVGILALGSLFFAYNREALYLLFVASNIPLTLSITSWVYLISYIFFPSVSQWPQVIAACALGATVTVATILTHPLPFVDASGGVNWNMPAWISALLSYMLFVNIGAPLIIFSHSFWHAKSREVKIVSLTLAVLALIGLVNNIGRYLPPGLNIYSLRTSTYDATHALMGMVFIVVFVLPPIFIQWFSGHKN